MIPDPFFILGCVGMVFILFGFLMVQTHRWSQDDLIYDIANLCGSILLIMYAVSGSAWPFVILNAVWAAYSLKDVVVDMRKMAKKEG